MKSNIDNLQKQKRELDNQKVKPELIRDTVKYLLDKLRNFITRIKIEPPDIQHELLKEYLVTVAANKLSGGFKLKCQLKLPLETNETMQIVLEKSMYFGLDLQ